MTAPIENNTGPDCIPSGTPQTVKEIMWAYDQLPTMLRKEVARAPYDLDPLHILQAFEAGTSAISLLLLIREQMQIAVKTSYVEMGIEP